ncbi:MAG: hypothetical protein M3126_07335 [Candidatus Eremiobacteraeota bacterium]|nr:hypothetical protein [Candidatus Eremiobacteraeota bacterium]
MKISSALLAILCFSAFGVLPLHAEQSRFDATVPRARQIQLAMSAAPSEISRVATIYVLGARGFERARAGRNGFSCLVDRNVQNRVAKSLEPKCFDAEGTRTLLPLSLRTEALRATGRSEAEIDADILAGYKSGRFHAPRKPGLIYMMSPYNILARGPNNTDFGHVAGHLMFYAPYMTLRDLGYASATKSMLPFLADPGTPYTMMIVVPKRQLGRHIFEHGADVRHGFGRHDHNFQR